MKKFRPTKKNEDEIQELLNLGCQVTATAGEIHSIIAPDNITLNQIENILKVKVKEVIDAP